MKTHCKETDAERHKKDGNVTRRQMTKGSLREKKRERQTLLEKNVEREMKKRDRRKEKETQNV